VPAAALAEAALVEGIEVLGADCLIDIVDWLRGDNAALRRAGDGDDLAAVSGEEGLRPWRAGPQ